MDVFTIAPNDQSIYYLGQIFGNVGVALAGPTGSGILGAMFKVFNTALLAIGALIVTYTTIVGVVLTAQEGKFLGQRWHSLWIPLRTVMGITALMPTSSGYCAIQVIMMWFIVQGVGAADQVWNTAINYVQTQGSVSAPPVSQSIAAGTLTSNVVTNIFSNLVCQAAATKFHANKVDAKAQVAQTTDNNGNALFNFSVGNVPAECGSVSAAGTGVVQTAQAQGLQASITGVLAPLADQYVMSIINDSNCWTACDAILVGTPACPYFEKYQSFNAAQCKELDAQTGYKTIISSSGGTNFVTAVSQLMQGIAENAATAAATASTTTNPMKMDTFDLAKYNGWIFAGAYYYVIAQKNNSAATNFTNFFTSINVVTPTIDQNNKQYFATASSYPDLAAYNPSSSQDAPTIVKYFYCGTTDATCAQNGALGVAAQAANAAAQSSGAPGSNISSSVGSGTNPGPGAGPASTMSSFGYGSINMWIDNMNTKSNPIASLQSFGQNLLIAAEVLFWLFFGVTVIGMGILASPLTALGTTVNFMSGVGGAVLSYFIPLVYFFLIYLVLIGGTFAVYLPLLPYMLFTFGAISWFIAAIEAMIAAPIVALGIIQPEGQHEILGKAEPSVMLLMSVFLRPTLMVFGMIAGMLLSLAVINMINIAFINVVHSIAGQTVGLIEGFFYIMAYAGIVMTSVNKCFALIHVIPDQVLRWVTGPTGHGEEGGEKVKQTISAGGEAAGATMRGAGQGIGTARGIRREAKKDAGGGGASAGTKDE